MEIEIETSSLSLVHQLKDDPNKPEGVSVHVPPFVERRDLSDLTINIVVTIVAGVSSPIAGAWLYEKIKDRATKATYKRKEIHIDKGEITKIIEEEIEEQ